MDPRTLLSHQVMLSDRRRLDAFRRALERSVEPGAVVADVGAGTLVLSALALRAGAARVFAVEGDPSLAALARRICSASGLQDVIEVVEGDARTVTLPAKVDAIVSEMFGNFGPEEEPFEVLRPFVRRNLRPGGVVVPESMRTYLAPVELGDRGWGVWSADFHGLDLSVVQDHASPVLQMHFSTRRLRTLADPLAVLHEDRDGTRTRWRAEGHRVRVGRAGTLQGLLGYFEAVLCPGVRLSNYPSYEGCNWAACLWPVRHTAVRPGDVLRIDFARPAGLRRRDVFAWGVDVQLRRGRGAVGDTPAAG